MKERSAVERRRVRQAAAARHRRLTAPVADDAVPPESLRRGMFYAINVLPRDGKRYKFGHTSNLTHQLEQYRAVVPDCILVRAWRCHPTNGAYVLRRMRSLPGVLPHSDEVADLLNPREVVGTIDRLFREQDLTVER